MSPLSEWVPGRCLRHRYRWRFDTSDRSPILEIDPHGETLPTDVERDVDVLGVQMRSGRIVKAPNFAACQDEATNGVFIARSAFQPIAKMDCA
jgi:hypothetical protein